MSQFRKNPITGDWIIMAPERAQRPDEFLGKKKPRRASPKSTCPFEDLQKTGNWPPLISDPNEKKWEVVLIKNKYPALSHLPMCAVLIHEGIYEEMEGIGHHDLVITRDHNKNLAHVSPLLAYRVLRMMQVRYKILAQDECLQYTSTIFNWGEAAGASLHHPHFQMITLPIVPPDIRHSLSGAKRYHTEHGVCAHCAILAYEKKMKLRVIDENEHAIVLAPFASERPFEVRVFPKKHAASFEDSSAAVVRDVALMLQSALRRIEKYLHDPDLNFFIHTAPLKDKKAYGYYHWHVEIVPKVSTPPAGFEIGTKTNINVILPENAAAVLRGKKFQRVTI